MFKQLYTFRTRNRQRGMSLVELMVAMTIGIIGIIVMFQIYSVTETRKRSIAGTSDADVSGRIALIALQHDIELAGYGFNEGASSNHPGGAIFGCKTQISDSETSGHKYLPDTNADYFPLTPVIIVDGGSSGAPDQIIELHGNSGLMVASKAISNPTDPSLLHVTSDSNVGVSGVQRGDLVVAVNVGSDQPFACALYEITNDQSASTLDLQHQNAGYTDAYNQSRTARYNGGSNLALSASVDSRLYNLGPRLLMNDSNSAPTRVYRNIWSISDGSTTYKNANGDTINAGKLVMRNDLDSATVSQEMADGIINMQAEYGLDQNDDGMITDDEWVNCDDGSADICKTANLYASASDDSVAKMWASVRAIRVAILTRGEYDKDPVTSVNPSWTCSTGTCNFTMSNIAGLTGDRADWHHYRYNVFETVIALKNVAWGSLLQ